MKFLGFGGKPCTGSTGRTPGWHWEHWEQPRVVLEHWEHARVALGAPQGGTESTGDTPRWLWGIGSSPGWIFRALGHPRMALGGPKDGVLGLWELPSVDSGALGALGTPQSGFGGAGSTPGGILGHWGQPKVDFGTLGAAWGGTGSTGCAWQPEAQEEAALPGSPDPKGFLGRGSHLDPKGFLGSHPRPTHLEDSGGGGGLER